MSLQDIKTVVLAERGGQPYRNGAESENGAGKKLRIALVSPPWFTVPPKAYGGTERIVALLADGLAARGHDVTLFAPKGSNTAASLVETLPCAMHKQMGSIAIETHSVLAAYGRGAADFDVIHDHTISGLAVAPFLDRPVVHTVHGAVLPDIFALYSALPSNVHLVAISRNQSASFPPTVRSTVIPNAIDICGIPWSAEPGDYLLFVGRAAPDKGPLEALQIAERADMPLRLLMKVNERAEQEYFEFLRPAFERPGVQVDLEPPEREKLAAYAGAYATLFPISWEEPFGLVMIESMAAGTPVIAYKRGSVPEVIQDGVTGFICGDQDEAVRALDMVPLLERAACRQRVESEFGASRSLDKHEHLYRALVRQELVRKELNVRSG